MKNTARGLLAATTAALIAITPAGPAAASPQTHTVVRGDTLSEIAYEHGVSLRSVFKANRMGMDTIIYPGQRIKVPGIKTSLQSSAPATSAPSIGSFVPPPHGERSPIAFPAPGSVQQAIIDKAKAMGVDPALAQAIGWQESNYREHVVSYAGAIGVMQVMPANEEWAGMLAGRKLDLRNTDDNITAGIAIIRWLVKNAPDQETAIAGYYQGLSSVLNRGMYEDTKQYVHSVQKYREMYS